MRAALILVAAVVLVAASAARADPLEVGVQDNRMIYDPVAQPIFLQDARELGASQVEMQVTPGDEAKASQAVDAVLATGLTPALKLTAGAEDPPFTPRAFAAWTSAVAREFQGRVRRWSIWNEPNCCGFLIPVNQHCLTTYSQVGVIRKHRARVRVRQFVTRRIRVNVRGRWSWVRRAVFVRRRVHGRWRWVRLVRYRWTARIAFERNGRLIWLRECTLNDLAREYRGLYDAGYAAIKGVDPGATVLTGEVAGRNKASEFMRLVAAAGDGPVVADGIATHPYNDVAYDSQDVINDARVVRLPAGGAAPTYFTENGAFARPTTGWMLQRVTDDATRARRLVDMWDLACHTAGVREQAQYMFAPQHGAWDTSILDDDWQPDVAFRALQGWLASHPECVRR